MHKCSCVLMWSCGDVVMRKCSLMQRWSRAKKVACRGGRALRILHADVVARPHMFGSKSKRNKVVSFKLTSLSL